jgi:hypothetical protein
MNSAVKAANAAAVARNAAASAQASANQAEASANQAQNSANTAKSYANSAAAASATARAAATAAGKDAQATAQAATEAYAAFLQKRIAEGIPQPKPADTAPTSPMDKDYFRLGNKLHGNNALARLAVKMWGGQCFQGAAQFICYNVNIPGQAKDRAMTVGDFCLFPGTQQEFQGRLNADADNRAAAYAAGVDPSVYGNDLLPHEAAHSDQWSHFFPHKFIAAYLGGSLISLAATGDPSSGNPFEINANPYKGGYWDWTQKDRTSQRIWLCVFAFICK